MTLLAAKLPPGDGRFAPGAMFCVGAKVAHAGHLYYNVGGDARHRPGSFAAATPPYTSPTRSRHETKTAPLGTDHRRRTAPLSGAGHDGLRRIRHAVSADGVLPAADVGADACQPGARLLGRRRRRAAGGLSAADPRDTDCHPRPFAKFKRPVCTVCGVAGCADDHRLGVGRYERTADRPAKADARLAPDVFEPPAGDWLHLRV